MIDYFEDTWIGHPNRQNGQRPPMCSVNMFNCYESDLPRLNYLAEGWNKVF